MKQGEIMRFKLMLAAIASLLMVAGAQAQDGARAFFPVPAGTNDIDLTTTVTHTEVSGNVFDSIVFTPSYRHTFDLGGDAATFLIGLPVGTVSGTLGDAPVAQGDLFVGGTIGLLGAPALTPMAYAQNPVGLSVSLSTKLFLPTGDYDSSRFVNLGQNRWSLQASLPISYVLGGSLLDPTRFDDCLELLAGPAKIILPVDVVALSPGATFGPGAVDGEVETFDTELPEGWMGLDIGPRSAAMFSEIISTAGTVLWNGPMGVFEDERFAAGTRRVGRAVAAADGVSVVGGGDSCRAIDELGLADQISFMSTGGGASLELLEFGDLPGLAALRAAPNAPRS